MPQRMGFDRIAMRIGVIATTVEFELGGIARSVPQLVAALAKSGLSERELTLDFFAVKAEQMTIGTGHGQIDLAGLGVNVKVFDNRNELKAALVSYVGSETKPDILYHVGIWDELNHFVARLARRSRVVLIASPRSMLDPWALQFRRWKKRLAWLAYARRDFYSARAVHVTAEMEAEYVRQTGYSGEVFVVPNGVELPKVIPSFEDNPVSKIKEKGDKVVLFLSRIHEKKGVLDLIAAIAELKPVGWQVVIAGNDDGGHLQTCKSLVREKRIEKQIHFAGPIEDKKKWACYAEADLFVLPSYSENFGIVVGEALGMGVPVITTTATPWREVEERGCGWWIEPGVASLVGALKAAMALDSESRIEMGRRGKVLIAEKYQWEMVAEAFVSKMRELAEEK